MSDGAFLEKARKYLVENRPKNTVGRMEVDWYSRFDYYEKCWPEILAVVEAARRYKNETITAHRLQMVETLDALDAKAEGL